MHFLPRVKFQIETYRTLEEVRTLLQSVTETERKWFTYPDREFCGKVGEKDFKIMPVPGDIVFMGTKMHVKNSFLPVIEGQIREERNRTIVDVRMRLFWFVFGFMVVWFSVPVFVFLTVLMALITGSPEGWGLVAATGMLILLGQIMVRCGFYFPAKKARRRLEELFGAVSMDV